MGTAVGSTVDDSSVVGWLQFHDTHERFDPGYPNTFSVQQLEDAVHCHDEHGYVRVVRR